MDTRTIRRAPFSVTRHHSERTDRKVGSRPCRRPNRRRSSSSWCKARSPRPQARTRPPRRHRPPVQFRAAQAPFCCAANHRAAVTPGFKDVSCNALLKRSATYSRFRLPSHAAVHLRVGQEFGIPFRPSLVMRGQQACFDRDSTSDWNDVIESSGTWNRSEMTGAGPGSERCRKFLSEAQIGPSIQLLRRTGRTSLAGPDAGAAGNPDGPGSGSFHSGN